MRHSSCWNGDEVIVENFSLILSVTAMLADKNARTVHSAFYSHAKLFRQYEVPFLVFVSTLSFPPLTTTSNHSLITDQYDHPFPALYSHLVCSFSTAAVKEKKKRNSFCVHTRAGHVRYFLIFSIIKNDFLHFLSS